MNYTKARHELHDFLGDTNYTNYHEGLRQLVQIAKIRFDRPEFRHFASEFV
jgi:hypothetical protein